MELKYFLLFPVHFIAYLLFRRGPYASGLKQENFYISNGSIHIKKRSHFLSAYPMRYIKSPDRHESSTFPQSGINPIPSGGIVGIKFDNIQDGKMINQGQHTHGHTVKNEPVKQDPGTDKSCRVTK